MRNVLLVLLALLLGTATALAVQPDEVLDDPELEARARAISAELRCMVCQNQSIDDSDAELAKDLRVLVRDRLKQGDSDEQVMNYVVDRYGEFVLLKPQFSARNILLWGTPVIVLLLAGLAIAMRLRNTPTADPNAGLTEAEQARLSKILDDRD